MDEPNSEDPLAEPTPNRRLWGARIKAGFVTRSSFAKAMDLCYSTINAWDVGDSSPNTENLAKACALAQITMEQYHQGHAASAGRAEPRSDASTPYLDESGIAGLLDELKASYAVGEIVGRVRYLPRTRTFWAVFIDELMQRLNGREERDAAIEAAWGEATRAMARANRLALGGTTIR